MNLEKLGTEVIRKAFSWVIITPHHTATIFQKGLQGQIFFVSFREKKNEALQAYVLEIYDEKGNQKDVANTNDIVFLKLSEDVKDYTYALGRTIGIKNESD